MSATIKRELGAGKVNDEEVAVVLGLQMFFLWIVSWEMAAKSPAGPVRDGYVKMWTKGLGFITNKAFVDYTEANLLRAKPMLMAQIAKSDDALIGSVLGFCFTCAGLYSGSQDCMEVSVDAAFLERVMSVWHRVMPAIPSSQWWEERSEKLDHDLFCVNNLCVSALLQPLSAKDKVLKMMKTTSEAQWQEIIDWCVSALKTNQSAQLSRRAKMPHMTMFVAARILAVLSSNSSVREMLLKKDVAPALLWASSNDFPLETLSLAGFAAGAACNLIGRNEDGLTLNREAVGAVLGNWLMYFNPSNRRASYPAHKLLTEAMMVADISISDSNKMFIIEHKGVFDGLVAALLLNENDPRTTQKGAAELQTASARTLQNLALSPVAARVLREHNGVIDAIRRLEHSGMSEEARSCASGALFELDERSRSAIVETKQQQSQELRTFRAASSRGREATGRASLS